MNKEKIESEIKELNAMRAMHQRDFREIEKKFNKKEISDKTFEKQKRKFDSKIEKIREKIRKLEEKNMKKVREKRYFESSG